MQWLSRVDVAGIEPLALAMGFGQSVMYSHVARLAAAGLVVRVSDPGGSMVASTAEGRRAAHAARTALDQQARAPRAGPVASAGDLGRFARPAPPGRRSDPSRPARGDRSRALAQVAAAPAAILAGCEHAIATGALSGGLIYVSDRPDVLAAVHRTAERVVLPDGAFATRTLEGVHADARQLAERKPPVTGTSAQRLSSTVVEK